MSRKPSLAKNAVLNTIKQCCAILFPLITSPYVFRVLGTDNYGKITFGQSIISYIILIASLGIAQYAIREGAKKRQDIDDINTLSSEVFTINLLSTLVAFIVFFLLLFLWPKLSTYRVLLLVQVSSVLFATLGTDWINAIYEDYKILTLRYIISHCIAIVLMFLLVRKSEDYTIYAAITAAAAIVPNILNIFYIKRVYHIKVRIVNPKKTVKHITPILILFASSVASLIYVNSDITIVGAFKGEYEVGLYGAAAKIYSLVKQVLNAFLYVAIPKVSNELKSGLKEKANSELNSILKVLVSLSLPASTGIFIFSRSIVLIVSGENFLGAESSLRLLSIALIFSTLACFYINVVLLPLGKEKIILIATIVSAVINIVLNFVLIPFFGRDAAALTTIISEIVMVAFGIIYSRTVFKFRIQKSILAGLLTAFGVVVFCFFTSLFKLNYILQLIICIFSSGCLYLLIMYLVNRDELIMFLSSFKRKKS